MLKNILKMQYPNPYIELCLEGSSSIFKGISLKEKEVLSQSHIYSIFKKGSPVFKSGEKPRGLICVASGKIKVFKVGVGGREQIVKMVKPFEIIGYRTLFTENIYTLSAGAIEETAVCFIDKNTLLKMLKKNVDLSFKFIKVLSEELSVSNHRTISLTQKHVRARLAESLLLIRDTYGLEVDGRTLRATLSREDIASLSNMTTSNAIRTLSNMAAEGLIALEGRKILLINIPILEQISEAG
jgi:CRP/FNR family transcriptional regulator, polysaccharide utilization system transcription regulator